MLEFMLLLFILHIPNMDINYFQIFGTYVHMASGFAVARGHFLLPSTIRGLFYRDTQDTHTHTHP